MIERCRPGTRLSDSHEQRLDVVAGLLSRMSLEPDEGHPFRLLRAEAERWADAVPHRWELAGRPFERSLLELAGDVLASVDATARTLVNQDLHAANVLRASREPWLVIDPKPVVGERELDGVGLLRNAALDEGSVGVRSWLDSLVELGLERDRLRGWGVAHALAWGTDTEGRWSQRSIETARVISRA